MRLPLKALRVIAHAAAFVVAGEVPATELVVGSTIRDPIVEQAFAQTIAQFEATHPSISVELRALNSDVPITSLRDLVSSVPPDVLTLFPGFKASYLIQRNLLDDISDVWKQRRLNRRMRSTLLSSTFSGRQYAMPYTYTFAGVYFNVDVFRKAGVEVPADWNQLVDIGQKLKVNGVTPTTLGSEPESAAAFWFDYLDLRINGLFFHMSLVNGEIPFTDSKVRAVFERLHVLVTKGLFGDIDEAFDNEGGWEQLAKGNAAMYLTVGLPSRTDERVEIGFFPFPILDTEVPVYEVSLVDTLHIPSRARNKGAARELLMFMAQPDIQGKLNKTIRALPPHNEAELIDDSFVRAGYALVNSAEGFAHSQERDMHPEMATAMARALRELLSRPDRLESILEQLEEARQRIYTD